MALRDKKGVNLKTGFSQSIGDNGVRDTGIGMDPEAVARERYQNRRLYLSNRDGVQVDLRKPFDQQHPADPEDVFRLDDIHLLMEYQTPSDGDSSEEPVFTETKKKDPERRTYFDPADVMVTKQGMEICSFNIEKTLRSKNMMWVTKIVPLRSLASLCEGKPMFDGIAQRQHELAVRLNGSTAQEQKKYENRRILKKAAVGAGVVLTALAGIVFIAIPRSRYNAAVHLVDQKDWANAYKELSNIGSYADTPTFGRYSRGQVALADKKFDDAKKEFESLLPAADMLADHDITLEDDISECDYQKALNLFMEHKYQEAMDLFKSLGEYRESVTYYHRAGYEIAEKAYEAGRYDDAMEAFYTVRSYGNALSRLKDIAQERYQTANDLYKAQRYEEAALIYEILSRYQYEDSTSMVSQCTYRNGLNQYEQKDYIQARKTLSPIIEYKDTNAIVKECTYRIALSQQAKSTESALAEYLKISEYRNVAERLTSPMYLIFGEWEIMEINGTKVVSPIPFKFNTGSVAECKKSIQNVALSTEASKIPYKWDGKQYATEDGKYWLSASTAADGYVEIMAWTKGSRTKYLCRRKAGYSVMLLHNQGVQQDDGDKTPLAKALQKYVDMKTDGVYQLGKEELDCRMIIAGAAS